MTTNKIRIDAPSGIVEVEGDKEFVEGQIERLLPILRGAGFGSKPASVEQQASPPDTPDADISAPSSTRIRRRPSNAPKGQSCRNRINVLRSKNYFATKRTITHIVEGLAKEGWTHNLNQVSASLTVMFGRGEIQRTKEDGGFKYYWDRG